MSNDEMLDFERDAEGRRQERRSSFGGRTVSGESTAVTALSDRFEGLRGRVRFRNRSVARNLRAAETVALTATVVAFAVTVLAVNSSAAAFEANPVTRRIVSAVGWTVSGCLAVAVVSGVFVLYRRVRNTAPRVVLVGATLVAALSVADMASTLTTGARVRFVRGLAVETAIPIVVTAAVAAGLWTVSGRIATPGSE